MKKLCFLVFFVVVHFCFSQKQKLLHGRIVCDQNPVQGIEIINLVSEKSTLSDENGEFNIIVNPNEMLYFISKKYEHKQKFIEKSDFELKNFKIILIKKPQELKEVEIVQKPFLTGFKNINAIIEKPYFDDKQSSPINSNVYTGQTPGANIFGIIGLISKLFKGSDLKEIKEKEKLDFAEIVKKSCDKNFFIKTLNLKEFEIPLFFEFCIKDEKVNRLIEPNEILGLMDFFIQKNKDFKMLPRN